MPEYKIKHSVVFEGGGLDAPWSVPTKLIDGVDYIESNNRDRHLARFVGMDKSRKHPIEGYNLFNHLQE